MLIFLLKLLNSILNNNKLFNKLFYKRLRKNTGLRFYTNFFLKIVLLPILLNYTFSLNLFFNCQNFFFFYWFWYLYFIICTFIIYRDYAEKGYEELYLFAFYFTIKIVFSHAIKWIYKYF